MFCLHIVASRCSIFSTVHMLLLGVLILVKFILLLLGVLFLVQFDKFNEITSLLELHALTQAPPSHALVPLPVALPPVYSSELLATERERERERE